MSNQPSNVLQRFFAGVTEQTFQTHLGVADPPLLDYLTTLLVRFVRHEAATPIRNTKGESLQHVSEMLAEADHRVGSARRQSHRQVGDCSLFWVGLFPEYLRRRRGRVQIGGYDEVAAKGKIAYLVASQLEPDDDAAPSSDILARLSDEFDLFAYGLREVRREWNRRDETGDPPVIFG